VIHTSRITPYGYGKNHGYAKLIRIAPFPLLLQVWNALSWALNSNNLNSSAAVPDASNDSTTSTTIVEVTMANVIQRRALPRLTHCCPCGRLVHSHGQNGGDDVVDIVVTSSPSSGKSCDVIHLAFVQSSTLNNSETEHNKRNDEKKNFSAKRWSERGTMTPSTRIRTTTITRKTTIGWAWWKTRGRTRVGVSFCI
jgi:hypothetical protein